MIQNYGSRFKIQNYGSRYIRYHLLQSITLSLIHFSLNPLSLNVGFDFHLLLTGLSTLNAVSKFILSRPLSICR
ncbi:hypothetical protein Hanom_Chr15g01382191 [Helianthus anomalus]